MLGSERRRQEICSECGTYFLTKGWLDYERNIWVEYQTTVGRFGKDRACRIYKAMLRHYQRLGIIDTGAYDVESILERARGIADELALRPQVIQGNIEYLKRLLIGPWGDDFVSIDPGVVISMEHIHAEGMKGSGDRLVFGSCLQP